MADRRPDKIRSMSPPTPRSDGDAGETRAPGWPDHLVEVTTALRSARREKDVHELLTRTARRATGAKAALLIVPGEDIRAPAVLCADGAEAGRRFVPGPSAAALGRSAARERRIISAHAGLEGPDGRATGPLLRELDADAAVLVPLIARGESTAVLLLIFDDVPAAHALEGLGTFVLPFALALDRGRESAPSVEQQFFAGIVEGSTDAIFSKDLDGIITSWNRGAERIYGYGPDEIIGRSVTMLVPDDIENDVPAILERLRRGEGIEDYETVRVTKDGRRLYVALTISPIRDAEGRLAGASTIARDITRRRITEQRSRIIADVGRALADTLDEEQTLRDLAAFLTRELCDYCVTYSLDAGGTVRRVGAAHADPAEQPVVERLLDLTPPGVFDAVGSGAVLRTGQPVLAGEIPRGMLVDAAAGSGEYLDVLLALRPVSSMILPLRARGRTVGAFACTSTPRSGRRYTEDDLAFAVEIANRAALAIDNARLLADSRAELQRRERVEAALRVRFEQLRVLYQMTEAVGRAADLDEIYGEAFHAMRRYLGNERASILLWDPDGVMRFKASKGLSREYRQAVEGHTPWARDAVDPPPIIVPDVTTAEDLDDALRATILAEGIRSMAFFPLVFGHRLLGKFMLYFDRPRALAADEIELCQAIGGTIAFAIRRMLDEQSVRTARDLAERASEAKSQFLGVMSHELRTPLNAVVGYADLLLMEIRGPLTAGQREQVDRMRASARHQLGLIEELLTYTRLEAGREAARLMTTDARRTVTDVAEFVRPETEIKGIDLYVELPDEPLDIVTDPAKLRQIILNFAGNAAKFTHHGKVSLRAWRDGGDVVIEVTDTGPGIPPDMLGHIFEPFAQAEEGRTRPSGGTGLGLAIARRFADMIGGEIGVSSEVGSGSTFHIRVPIRGVVAGAARDPG